LAQSITSTYTKLTKIEWWSQTVAILQIVQEIFGKATTKVVDRFSTDSEV